MNVGGKNPAEGRRIEVLVRPSGLIVAGHTRNVRLRGFTVER